MSSIEQFVLLSIEAWRRLHALDTLLAEEQDATEYHKLLYGRARHSPYLSLQEFRGQPLIFGPQALTLLIPALGYLAKLYGKDSDATEHDLQTVGLQLPNDYDAILKPCGGYIIKHPRTDMLRCMRNAAAHHMEAALSPELSGQSIVMPEDGSKLVLVTKQLELEFSSANWAQGYIALLTQVITASKRVILTELQEQARARRP